MKSVIDVIKYSVTAVLRPYTIKPFVPYYRSIAFRSGIDRQVLQASF